MKIARGFLFALIIICALVPALDAQQAIKQKSPGFSLEPFNLELEALPPAFVGHDFDTLYKNLMKIESSMIKDEFETTEQYLQRIDKNESSPIVGSLGYETVYAAQLRPGHAVYDADSQTLSAYVGVSSYYYRSGMGLDSSKHKILLNVKQLSSRTSIRSNTFGANVEVTSTSMESDYLVFDKKDIEGFPTETFDDPDTFREYGLVMKVRVPLNEAKRIKEDLRVLALFKLTRPYASEATSLIEPTIDYPYESLSKNRSLYTSPLEFWAYDPLTGKVLLKLKHSAGAVGSSDDEGEQTAEDGRAGIWIDTVGNCQADFIYEKEQCDEALSEIRNMFGYVLAESPEKAKVNVRFLVRTTSGDVPGLYEGTITSGRVTIGPAVYVSTNTVLFWSNNADAATWQNVSDWNKAQDKKFARDKFSNSECYGGLRNSSRERDQCIQRNVLIRFEKLIKEKVLCPLGSCGMEDHAHPTAQVFEEARQILDNHSGTIADSERVYDVICTIPHAHPTLFYGLMETSRDENLKKASDILSKASLKAADARKRQFVEKIEKELDEAGFGQIVLVKVEKKSRTLNLIITKRFRKTRNKLRQFLRETGPEGMRVGFMNLIVRGTPKPIGEDPIPWSRCSLLFDCTEIRTNQNPLEPRLKDWSKYHFEWLDIMKKRCQALSMKSCILSGAGSAALTPQKEAP